MAKPRIRGAAAPWALAAWLALAAACGYTDAGTGSRTLQVNGTLTYNPIGDSDRTIVSLEVTKQDVPITNAMVQITDADTRETFTVPSSGTKFAGAWPGYHRRIALHIVSGDDNVSCRLEGPGRHTVSAPAHASTQSANAPLEVAWRTTDGVRGEAITLKLSPGPYTATLAGDEGNARIAAPVLEPGPASISVSRRTGVVPIGAVAPSAVYFDYEVANEFIVR